jgi:beta-glucosidase/6-phospho-beta-glucosidase/beta-galactosidase
MASVAPLALGPHPDEFIWASGVENTFIPQTRRGHRALDEYQLMGHYEHWRADLALAHDLGLRAVRWGVPWYRVEPLPGEFDWRWTDQVVPYLVEELGLTPIVDLMHYGCPYWLPREFANPQYPQAVAAYAAAFARRYAGRVRWYTPLNEPLVNAELCGRRGAWPPYLRGPRGYVRVLMQLVRGIRATAAAIRAVDPAAVLVHVDAAAIVRAAVPDLEAVAYEGRLHNFLPYDLVLGRVTPTHPLYAGLVAQGVTPRELARWADNPVPLDVMGLNFYPQWSTQEFCHDAQGGVASHPVHGGELGFEAMVAGYYARYGLPIMITETSARDSEVFRSEWLGTSLTAIRSLRGQGVPVLGYTWFPLFTMIDWAYRWQARPLHDYLLHLGLYRLAHPTQARDWIETPVVPQLRGYIQQPDAAIGRLTTPAPAPDEELAA